MKLEMCIGVFSTIETPPKNQPDQVLNALILSCRVTNSAAKLVDFDIGR
jgi:hypothetical protein